MSEAPQELSEGEEMSEPTYEELIGSESAADEDLEEGAKLAAHDLFLRLQSSFSAPAYITLEEVRDATGFDGVRTADAMAISLYRSRGKAIWGFEMKVSRNDWLKELKQPEKSESILRYCHHWGLVVPNKDIVKPGELPESWGMYVAQKNRLKCVVPCPRLDPLPMSITMLTALIYAVSNCQSKADEAALNKARDDGYKEGVSRVQTDHYEEYYKELKEKVDAYEKASGLLISYGWTQSEKIGKVVRMLMDGKANIKTVLEQAKYGVGHAERIRETLQKQVDVLQAAFDGIPQKEDDDE